MRVSSLVDVGRLIVPQPVTHVSERVLPMSPNRCYLCVRSIQRQEGIELSEHTIRHILRREVPEEERQRKKGRQVVYPAHWAWEQEEPVRLFQVDAKDIADKGALGTERVTHLYRTRLPRYQWTALEGRSRLRFLAYSHELNRTNGVAFLLLVLMWLRSLGVEEEVEFQTDWGQEFGGDNPEQVRQLSAQFLEPLGGKLCRYLKGRKGYNGRVERSHRTDDEEFYAPCLLSIPDETTFLYWALRWEYVYNVLRPHQGKGMNGQPPLSALKRLGYDGDERIALFPTILLDRIAADLLLAVDQPPGNDVLTYYTQTRMPTLIAVESKLCLSNLQVMKPPGPICDRLDDRQQGLDMS